MSLLKTPLDSLHRKLGARMVPFAGYEMPVQYPGGIIREHQHTRRAAGLFDVSHMGQLEIDGADAAADLESLLPADLESLPRHGQVYTLLTRDDGGILDDLIVTRRDDESFFLVVNAACRQRDISHLRAGLGGRELRELDDRALLALQGPAARDVLSQLLPEAADLTFMRGAWMSLGEDSVYVTCSGYTGEDGFELSVPAAAADAIARRLLAFEEVEPVGLGARDSLRLEAGLCLYGHELGEDLNPVEAGLFWAIGRARRPGGERAGGFPGAGAIFRLHEEGTARRRVGLTVEGRRPVREEQAIVAPDGAVAGVVTSAGFGASVGHPIAMGYVDRALAEPGTALGVEVRGKVLPVTVSRLPFVKPGYFRG